MARCLVRQNPRKSVAPVRLAEAIGADMKTRHRPMTLVHFQCSKRDTNIIIGIHYQLHIRLNIHSSNQFSRIDAAKIIVDRAGFVAGAPPAAAFDKELEVMSLDELQKLIGDLTRERAAAAKDVTPARPDDESADDAPADDTPPQPH
jgi:hypothetical protein